MDPLCVRPVRLVERADLVEYRLQRRCIGLLRLAFPIPLTRGRALFGARSRTGVPRLRHGLILVRPECHGASPSAWGIAQSGVVSRYPRPRMVSIDADRSPSLRRSDLTLASRTLLPPGT